jgi:arylsulfatase A-like enzyme
VEPGALTGSRGDAPPDAGGADAAGVWLWPLAGLLGGVLAGVGDAALAVARGVGGLGTEKAARLVLLSASLLGLVGLVAGALLGRRAGLTTRLAPARRRRVVQIAAALAGAPLWLYDAFALFGGHRAAQIPGRRVISLALFAAASGATCLLAGKGVDLLARLRQRAIGRRRARLIVLALLAVAVGLHLANRGLLPRLYGWFHATLSVLTFALALLSARVGLGARALRAGRAGPRSARGSRARLVVAAALTLAATGYSFWHLRKSQILRFAAYERTAMTGLVLRGVPLSLAPRTVAAAERQATEQLLPALPDGPRRPEADVVVITIDALRADHVGAYGYTRHATTPHIDALARTATRFERAYAQAPHTSFSIASMLTGKYFPTLARLAPGEIHAPIASVLRNYGWRTAAFFPPAVFYVDAQKLKAYADNYFNFEYVKFEYLDAERRVDQVESYFDTVKPVKAFLWVHFFEPHEPYEAHAAFPFGAADIDRYDSEIAYVDKAVGRLIDYLRRTRPGAIIVIAADHGEEFDEHGGRYHGSALYDEQLRIPMIVAVPGVPAHVISGPVQLIDVTPTVLNLLDIPVPARMRGTDLGPWLATPPADPERLPPAFAELEDKRMVVWKNEKLICDLNWGFCAYYDLLADPGEHKNLAEERPDRAAFLRGVLDRWLDDHVRLEPLLAKGASNPQGGPVPRAIERGRLGDLLAAPDLAALMISSAAVEIRREAAQLLAALPPRRETAAQLQKAVADRDKVVADWASVGAVRLGDDAARARVRGVVGDAGTARMLRIRGALALAQIGDPSGVPAMNESLDHCDDVLLCRLIIINMGRLRDRRAVPALLAHLPEVQNRREMVDALGDIGDPAAEDALLVRLREDQYVTVRVQAARALAKLGDAAAIPALERSRREETETTVAAAASEAIAALTKLAPRAN